MDDMSRETPEPNYEKLMLWSFITIFALLGFFTVYNHYFPEENKPRRPVPTQVQQQQGQGESAQEGQESGASNEAEQPSKSQE